MRPKHRHSPQGTHGVFDEGAWARVDSMAKKVAAAADVLPDDPDVFALISAVEGRDNAEAARLLLILKRRYGERWAAIGRACLDFMGRSVLRRRKA